MSRFFLSTSEYNALKQCADNYNAVVQSVVSVTQNLKAEDVTPDVISELLNAEPSGSNSYSDLLVNANNKITELESERTADIALLDAIDPTVKAATSFEDKVAAINAKLANRAGVQPESPQGESGNNDTPKDCTDWDTIDNLPHNKDVDKFDY